MPYHAFISYSHAEDSKLAAAVERALKRFARPWYRKGLRVFRDKTSLSAGYLNHIVHGNRPVPSNEVLGRIAKALGVKPDYFREVRVRVITEKLEQTPALVERLYKRLA